MKPRVLILDRDPDAASELESLARQLGCEGATAAGPADVHEAASRELVDLVLADREAAGAELLRDLSRLPRRPAVVLTAERADGPTALEALRSGAADLLERPVRREHLAATLGRLVRLQGPSAEAAGDVSGRLEPLVGTSEPILATLEQIARVARTDRSTVLVLGESGTGKELVSRAIHERSARSRGPFVAVNCAALTDSLLEAELFGYEPGAFTGASRTGRDGLLAAAHGGTLLLDEVGELAPTLQAKLLRVLQERTYRRVGGHEDRPFDARVVASTHRDLVAMVAEGTFREDLFYRLNVLSIHVPPLRERGDDLPLLAKHFLAAFAAEQGREPLPLTQRALDELRARRWPGNVRELRNALERASLFAAEGAIDAGHLGAGTQSPRPSEPPAEGAPAPPAGGLPLGDCSLKSVEEALIRHVMRESEGNRSRAARVLGVNRSTLYSKLRTYQIA